MRAETLLVVVCGLPGAGKTALCRAAVTKVPEIEPGVRVEHLEFDKWSAGSTTDIEEPIEHMQPFNPAAWKALRASFLAKIAAKVKTAEHRRVLLVDDNMHLRSMRHECFRIARAGSACFVIVHVATPIDTSLARNAARPPSLAVPSEVVLRMAQAMDVPGPGGPPFESNLLKLPADGDWDATVARFAHGVLSLWGPAPRVPPSEAELMERRARGQLANQQSALHGLDMACRKHIGELVSTLRERGVTAEGLQGAVAEMNEARQNALREVRESGSHGIAEKEAVEVAWSRFDLHAEEAHVRALLGQAGL